MRNYYARNCKKFFKNNQKKELINVIFVVQICVNRKEIIKHMFITMILYLNIK
jgi:hypothetical protein